MMTCPSSSRFYHRDQKGRKRKHFRYIVLKIFRPGGVLDFQQLRPWAPSLLYSLLIPLMILCSLMAASIVLCWWLPNLHFQPSLTPELQTEIANCLLGMSTYISHYLKFNLSTMNSFTKTVLLQPSPSQQIPTSTSWFLRPEPSETPICVTSYIQDTRKSYWLYLHLRTTPRIPLLTTSTTKILAQAIIVLCLYFCDSLVKSWSTQRLLPDTQFLHVLVSNDLTLVPDLC